MCNAALNGQTKAAITLYFCPAGHGAAIDGPTLAAHVHRDTQTSAMRDVIGSAPRVAVHGRPRRSPWYPGETMELRQIEGVTDIDYCAHERGVWLDTHEILVIVNAMRLRPAQPRHGREAVRAIADTATDIGLNTADIWGETAIDAATRTAQRAVSAPDVIVEAIGTAADAVGDASVIGEVVGAIVEFIADALW